jgi:uroporphyrin-3 C-methyltransferase
MTEQADKPKPNDDTDVDTPAAESETGDAVFASADDTDGNDDAEANESTAESAPRRSRSVAGFLALLAIVASAAALAGVGWLYVTRTSVTDIDFASPGDVAETRRAVESLGETISGLEERVDALAALEERAATARAGLETSLRRDLEALDDRLGTYDSLPPRVGNLESSVAAMQGIEAGARDTLLLAEAGNYLKIANALLTLAGDVELAKVALGMADDRLVSIGNPALNNVRQAISDSITALDMTEQVDVETNAMLLASLARLVDSLPLKPVEGETERVDAGEDAAAEPGVAGKTWNAVKEAVFGAVKVTRPGDESTPLLLPGTEPLIRANLALQLQAARLALLRGQQSIFDQSLDDADAWLEQYFDGDSMQVQSARTTLAEIRAVSLDTSVPDISEPLTLLRQYEALSEPAP